MPAALAQFLGLVILFTIAILGAVALYLWLILRETLHPPRGGYAYALARGLPTTPEGMNLPTRSFDVALGSAEERESAPNMRMPVWEVSREISNLDDRDRTLRASQETGAERLRIVLLHGWGRSRIDSLGRLPAFLIEDAEVYLPDLRGHGDSRLRTRLGSAEVDDLDRLLRTLPPGPVVLAGHSMGATIAIRGAALGFERDRVRGVIAIAPYDTLRTPIGRRLEARDLPTGIFLTAVLRLMEWLGIPSPSTVDAAGQLAVPLLVLQGARDRISPADEARRIAAAARAGTYIEFPDVEHADHHLRAEEAFTTAVRGFLRSVVSNAR